MALPPRLFSHNDQQSVWQATSPEGALAGWGGIFTDLMVEQGISPDFPFAALTTARDSLFVTGYDTVPYVAGAGCTESLGWGYCQQRGGVRSFTRP